VWQTVTFPVRMFINAFQNNINAHLSTTDTLQLVHVNRCCMTTGRPPVPHVSEGAEPN
jgi:hypothetical protein